MTSEATDKLSGTDLVSISLKARDLADSAIIAYWTESYGLGTDFHRRGAIDSLRALADLCGFDLVEKPADTIEDADLRGDMAAARAREMNAELTAATSAILKVKGMIE